MDSKPATKKATMMSRTLMLYGFAISAGVILAGAAMFIGGDYSYVAIPIIAYMVNSLFNALTQASVCDGVKFGRSFKLGIYSGVAAVVTLLLLRMSFFYSPIRALFPGSTPDLHKKVGDGFYFFWAGLYAQLLTGGLAQSC